MPSIDIRTERLIACPLCGGRRRRSICHARDRQHATSSRMFRYSRCGGCGVVYQSHRPTEAEIAACYPSDYGPFQAPNANAPNLHEKTIATNKRQRWRGWAVAMSERFNRTLIRRYPDPLPAVLESFYTPPRSGATVLDFGCGSPDFLDRARARGWNTIGADFIRPVVESVRQVGHRAFFCDDSLWDAIPDGSLDL